MSNGTYFGGYFINTEVDTQTAGTGTTYTISGLSNSSVWAGHNIQSLQAQGQMGEAVSIPLQVVDPSSVSLQVAYPSVGAMLTARTRWMLLEAILRFATQALDDPKVMIMDAQYDLGGEIFRVTLEYQGHVVDDLILPALSLDAFVRSSDMLGTAFPEFRGQAEKRLAELRKTRQEEEDTRLRTQLEWTGEETWGTRII